MRLLGLSFSVLGDVPNWDSGQTQSPSSIGLWLDPKFEFSGTKSPDPDPGESQIYLLGWVVYATNPMECLHVKCLFVRKQVPPVTFIKLSTDTR